MTTKLMSKTQQEHIEDVLLKSRMREIFTSGSVRGLIATLGLLPQQKVGYGLYSTVRKEICCYALRSLRTLRYIDY